MRRRTSLHTSTRSTRLDVPADRAWGALVSADEGRHWYADAPPLLVRQALDRLLGGPAAAPLPPHAHLGAGDRAGLWRVREADPAGRRLVLEAEVRAPGRVLLTSSVLTAPAGGSELRQSVSFAPSGLLGAAYLVTDLPARELFTELVHRRAVAEVRSRGRDG